MKWILAIISAGILYTPVNAAPFMAPVTLPCNDSATVLKNLQDKYNEQAVGGGVTPGGGQIRLFVSPENTFTVIMSTPDGTSCILTGGTDWTTDEAKPTGTDS